MNIKLHVGHLGEGEYRREIVIDEQSGQVAVITGITPDIERQMALLLAAAPELLEACQTVLLGLVKIGSADGDMGKTLRAAIAKAEGK